MSDALPNDSAKNGPQGDARQKKSDSGRTILAGVLGGVASAVGYAIYQRLPDAQREKLHDQVRDVVADRLNDLRSNFKI